MNVESSLAGLGKIERRNPYGYSSSWQLEEVTVVTEDGRRRSLIIKHIGDDHPAKPAFVSDPAREIETYAALGGLALGLPRCHAAGRWWLILEKVAGTELWQHADLSAWQAAARWARRLHDRFLSDPPAGAHLLVRDEAFFRAWIDRAATQTGGAVQALLPAAQDAVARLLRLPATLIHGELYPSNILIADERVAVVDWEMAGVGPGVIDLAALVTGWPVLEQARIVAAYGGVDPADLAAARLLLALQWLGWSPAWQPPEEHRRDWLTEAAEAAAGIR